MPKYEALSVFLWDDSKSHRIILLLLCIAGWNRPRLISLGIHAMCSCMPKLNNSYPVAFVTARLSVEDGSGIHSYFLMMNRVGQGTFWLFSEVECIPTPCPSLDLYKLAGASLDGQVNSTIFFKDCFLPTILTEMDLPPLAVVSPVTLICDRCQEAVPSHYRPCQMCSQSSGSQQYHGCYSC